MIPIGERAVLWIEKYLADARPQLVCSRDEGVLFLNCTEDLREWGWGKCPLNEAACSVGRSRTLQARPNSCMRCCGCRPSQGTSRA